MKETKKPKFEVGDKVKSFLDQGDETYTVKEVWQITMYKVRSRSFEKCCAETELVRAYRVKKK